MTYLNIQTKFCSQQEREIKGALPISTFLTSPPDKILSSVMYKEFYFFKPEDPADLVVRDFEKYDLTSAAVINNENHVVGRLKAVSFLIIFVKTMKRMF